MTCAGWTTRPWMTVSSWPLDAAPLVTITTAFTSIAHKRGTYHGF